jgi:hypothetical protein
MDPLIHETNTRIGCLDWPQQQINYHLIGLNKNAIWLIG